MGQAAIPIFTTLIGAYSASRNRRAAAQDARNLSQPQRFSQTTTRAPAEGTQGLIDLILGGAEGAFNAPLPDFPGFVGFPGFEGVDFQSFRPELTGITETPDIPGGAESLTELAQLRRLNREDPFLGNAGEALEMIFDAPSESFQLAQNYLLGGPLARTAEGFDVTGRFDDSVANALGRDADEILERQLQQIRGNVNAVGRSGPEATLALEQQAAKDVRQDILDALAAVRAASFESGEQRRLTAGQTVSGGLSDLAGLRSNEILSAASLAPQLEQARFIGPGLAAGVAGNVDQLEQAAQMFEATFGQNERGRSQSNLLALLGLEEGSRQFGAGLGARESEALNAFNLDEFSFEAGSPFLRLSQLANLVLPFASQFGTETTTGFNQQNQFPRLTPSLLEGGLSGLFGGLQLQAALNAFRAQSGNVGAAEAQTGSGTGFGSPIEGL